MSGSEGVIYVIKGHGTEMRRDSPGDAFCVYENFVRAYGEDNVQLGIERTVYETISPDELRTRADQEKRLVEERKLAEKRRFEESKQA